MRFRFLSFGLAALAIGSVPAQAQNSGGAGGRGGDGVVNIYGGNIYLTPRGGDGGEGGSVRRGGAPSPQGGGGAVGGASLWDHNGSTMRLVSSGSSRRFLYARPRPGIVAAGAAPGTLLFEGARRGDSYSGTAYVFAWECGSFPYQVTGRVVSETEIVMQGMAPSVSRGSCAVEGYRQDRLVFSHVGVQ